MKSIILLTAISLTVTGCFDKKEKGIIPTLSNDDISEKGVYLKPVGFLIVTKGLAVTHSF